MLLRRPLLSLLALAALASAPFAAQAQEKGPVLVELYTSQGCSSCPPADAFLGKLAQMDGVIALSFHVDYWDYIGWKDPFAKPANSLRQRAYAKRFDKSFVYTPQMVIQGLAEASGSDVDAVMARIKAVAGAPSVPVRLSRGPGGELVVSLPASAEPAQAAVWLVIYDSRHTTKVRRGENRGRTLENFNVVTGFTKIGEWRGERVEFVVTREKVAQHGGDECAVFLQSEKPGPVLGAARIALAGAK